MRNIKMNMRKAGNTALFFAATTGLLYLTSCSSEVNYGPNENIAESSVTIGNDPSAQSGRIVFYGTPGTRAASDFPELPTEIPGIPDGTIEYDTPNKTLNLHNTTYVLTGGSDQITAGGNTIYITGTVTTHNINGSGTIYVMPGAKLLVTSDLNISEESTIYAYGDIEFQKGLTVGKNSKIIAANDIIIPGRTAVNEGSLVTKETLEIKDELQIGYNSKVKAKCIYVEKEKSDAINMSGGGEIAFESYLACKGIFLGSCAKMYFWPNSLADIDYTFMEGGSQVAYYDPDGTNSYAHALLRTNMLKANGGYNNDPGTVGGMFAQNLKVKYTSLDASKYFIENFVPSADTYFIPKGGCNPGNGVQTPGDNGDKDDEGEEEKPFTPIAKIEGASHDHHHLSATCVQASNGRAYVSYHLNEAYEDNGEYVEKSKHMGCIEVFNVTEQNAEITSWLMNEDFDFNHLIVDDNKIYATGDTYNFGATLGVITLNESGNFGQYELDSEGRSDVMTYYNLYPKAKGKNGSSGNCIIRDGNTFRVASYRGFQSINVNDMSIATDYIATTGSAKHIAQGGGYIVTLNLDEKGVTESSATVNVYTTWGIPTATFKTNKVITPINGKNVISTDGTHIYVALGQKGVDKYDMSGNLVGNYSYIDEKLASNPNYKGKPLANGLFVDEKYVYVANGGVGLIVLNKTNMKRVARYNRITENTEYSANYVQKVGELIYIAYGRNGLEVVKMNEK